VTNEITKGYSDDILWVLFDVPSKGHIKHTEKGGDILNRKVLAIALTIIGIVVLAFAINVQAPAPSEPFTRYRFIVEIDGIAEMSFLEVEGLGVSVDVVEYREGDDLRTYLMPGQAHYGPLSLRNGVSSSTALLDWMEETVDGQVMRRSMSIIVLDPSGSEVARYNVYEAWPSSWRLGSLSSEGEGPVVEELVVQYEWFERGSF